MTDICEQLRVAARLSGKNPYRLAKESSVPLSSLSRFLRKERQLSVKNLSRLCEVLNWQLRPIRSAINEIEG